MVPLGLNEPWNTKVETSHATPPPRRENRSKIRVLSVQDGTRSNGRWRHWEILDFELLLTHPSRTVSRTETVNKYLVRPHNVGTNVFTPTKIRMTLPEIDKRRSLHDGKDKREKRFAKKLYIMYPSFHVSSHVELRKSNCLVWTH